jgi:hypothetical protein
VPRLQVARQVVFPGVRNVQHGELVTSFGLHLGFQHVSQSSTCWHTHACVLAFKWLQFGLLIQKEDLSRHKVLAPWSLNVYLQAREGFPGLVCQSRIVTGFVHFPLNSITTHHICSNHLCVNRIRDGWVAGTVAGR